MDNNQVGYLLAEETNTNVEFTIKETNHNGFVIAEGILQEGDQLNRNRRMYPTSELAKSVQSPRTRELISTGNLKGEAGHPSDASLQRQTKIDPTLEQVWYTKMWMDGNYVKAHFRGTNNNLGRSFNDDLKDGQKPSFSLRAVGSLVNEGGKMVVSRMQMITYDRVYFPSHSKAYTTKLVTTESFGNQNTNKFYEVVDPNNNFYYKTGEMNSLSESGNLLDFNKPIITKLTQQQVNNFLIEESANIQNAMNTFDTLYESMQLDPTAKMVSMRLSNGDTIHLALETAIRREIMDGVSKYF